MEAWNMWPAEKHLFVCPIFPPVARPAERTHPHACQASSSSSAALLSRLELSDTKVYAPYIRARMLVRHSLSRVEVWNMWPAEKHLLVCPMVPCATLPAEREGRQGHHAKVFEGVAKSQFSPQGRCFQTWKA